MTTNANHQWRKASQTRGLAREIVRTAWGILTWVACWVVPGWGQWWAGHRERGAVVFAVCSSAACVAGFAWGTFTGALVLALGYFIHVAAVSEIVRSHSFPPPRPAAVRCAVGCGLLFGLYLPMLVVVSAVAWPGADASLASSRFLVDRRAFREGPPRPNDWVWYQTVEGEPRVGRVVAGRGEEVVWSERRLHVNGRPADPSRFPFGSQQPPTTLAYRVPEGHVLVDSSVDRETKPSRGGLVIVAHEHILGRPWVKMYPIRDRQFLPRGSSSPVPDAS